MLSVFMVPMVYRPVDFANNIKAYVTGFLSYIVLMPMFITIFSIYAFTNLHDVSCGNRPDASSSGMEAVSQHQAQQDKAKLDYQLYRSNFSLFWFFVNGMYYIFVIVLVQSPSSASFYSGELTYLDMFTMYLATLVCFRSFFAALYVIKWRFRYNYNKKYQVKEHDLAKIFKDMKRNPNQNGDSSDDEQVQKGFKDYYKKEKATLKPKKDELMASKI